MREQLVDRASELPGDVLMRRSLLRRIVDDAGVLLADQKAPQYACFVVLRNQKGEILLAPRNTAPHVGLLGAIGGKVDRVIHQPEDQPAFQSSLTRHFVEGALESPWEAALRELQEEAFRSTDIETLRAAVQSAQKLGMVYDAQYNAYCRLYLVDLASDLHFQVSTRELGDPIPVTAEMFAQGKVNDLTALALLHAKVFPEVGCDVTTFQAQPISRMAVPRDFFRFVTGDASGHAVLALSHQIKNEPGFIIHAQSEIHPADEKLLTNY